ncbi:M4 family metallopeptidase [Taibaiella soli]|uniref:Peptidase M4 n=1 Tax=Taibaiella soli TaxID=1649169 RepID=A0A2W2B865_9BACT|nr:M4 family metallopeptidase [Taibaiella soli]PZF72157.1 hypothetical protein DN068_14575 [Taibaiella soli]
MKRKITLLFLSGLSSTLVFGQTAEKVQPGNEGMYPSVVEFKKGQEPPFVKGKIWLQQNGGFTETPASLMRVDADPQLKQEHYRYQQQLNGIPVEGALYIVHVGDGKVLSQNGAWVDGAQNNLETKPALTAEDALQKAMHAFGARSYKWQSAEEEAFLKRESNNPNATFYPNATLVYYAGENEISPAKMRLAYKLDIYAQDPVGRRIYFIDAETGTVLGARELMHNTAATGTAQTGYSGTQTIQTDSYNGSYRLREATRGNGVQTYNLKKTTNYSNAVDFTDADDIWNNVNANLDQYATDAHWGAEMTYDFYKNNFNRNSIDGNGYAINSYVHYSQNYFNAFWDGTRMTYGDGNATDGNKPLTALDVCGHEITHGLTSFTANLNYSYESGALNEGISDCMGTSIEFYARPNNANWLIGSDFYTLRSMSDPKSYGQPNTYKGVNWATGGADNGGVHTNSGVLNYWYFLVSAGNSGVNDNGTSYSVSGIGIGKAAAILYRTLTLYLTPTSQYADTRTYSIKAATDLYGAGSNEVLQVTNAWTAVGLGNTTPPPPACADNYESNNTQNTAKSIPVNTDIAALISSTTDKDWFKFTTTNAAPKFKVTLTNLPADYDIRLYNSNGKQLGISQNGGTTSESITYNTPTKGASYYLQVYGYAGAYSANACYTLHVGTSSVNQLLDDGEDSTEGIKSTAFSTLDENDLTIYPNPARNAINIRFTASQTESQSLIITDIVGRVVMTRGLAVQEGENDLQISLNNLQSGMYFLKLEGRQTVKFQIME